MKHICNFYFLWFSLFFRKSSKLFWNFNYFWFTFWWLRFHFFLTSKCTWNFKFFVWFFFRRNWSLSSKCTWNFKFFVWISFRRNWPLLFLLSSKNTWYFKFSGYSICYITLHTWQTLWRFCFWISLLFTIKHWRYIFYWILFFFLFKIRSKVCLMPCQFYFSIPFKNKSFTTLNLFIWAYIRARIPTWSLFILYLLFYYLSSFYFLCFINRLLMLTLLFLFLTSNTC